MRVETAGALPPALGLLALSAAKLSIARSVVPNYPAFVLFDVAVIVLSVASVVGTRRLLPVVFVLLVGSLIAAIRVMPSLRFDHPLRLDLLYVLASLQCFVVLTTCSLRCELLGGGPVAAVVIAHHWVSYSGSAGGGYVLALLLSAVSVLLFWSLRLVRLVEAQRGEAVRARAREAELNRRLASTTAALVEDKRRESMALLSASLAHEVNNPLHHMSGNLQFADEHVDRLLETCKQVGADDRPWVRAALMDLGDILSQFRVGLERIGEVVSELRSLSHSPRELDPTTDVAAACRRAIHLIGASTAHRIDVCMEVETGTRVACDKADLFTVLSNILTNSVEAIPDKGSIEIGATHRGGMVQIEVCDSGVGIPSDQIEAVFEPFYTLKAETATSASSDHLGVGLSLCRSIVERMGGTIAIVSREGESTCVKVVLPGTSSQDGAVSETREVDR